jgi:hypothetical protein
MNHFFKLIVCAMGMGLYCSSLLAQIQYVDTGQSLGNSAFCATGDLDGDGDTDVVTSYWFPPLNIYLNDGQGQFTLNGQSISIAHSWEIALADLDSDDDLDLFITTGSSNRVYFNDGTGQFIDSGQRLGNLPSMDVELGDVDSDGDIDAVIGNFHTNSGSYTRNTIWLNDGTGRFVDSGENLGITVSDNLELGDVNGDGHLDVVVMNYRSPGDKIWLGDGSGQFSLTHQSFGMGGLLALADFDGDTDLDLFRGEKNAPSEIWLNEGTGLFTRTNQILENAHGLGIRSAEARDMDGDGDMDVVVALAGGADHNPNMVWLNDGQGHFTDSGLRLGNGQSEDVALGDFNRDGMPDFYFSNRADSSDKVWLNAYTICVDPNGPIQNTSAGQRFSSIQCAVDYAHPNDVLVIEPGIYEESIILNKDVTLQSIDPNVPFYIGGTIIQGDPNEPVVTLNNNTAVCTLAGLTLRAGSVGISGTATHATIHNCRFMDNFNHGVDLHGASPTLSHCLITSNGGNGINMQTTRTGIGRQAQTTSCKSVIENCIIVENGASGLEGGEPVVIDSIIQE